MSRARQNLWSFQSRRLAVVLGTNEIASAVAISLLKAGYATVMSHDPYPPVIRRGMAFHDALFDDYVEISGIVGRRAEDLLEIASVTSLKKSVAVTPLSLTDLLALRLADVLVDARMQKQRITPDFRGLARITVGLGPKFVVAENCDIAVETRPARTGAVVEAGATEDADGVSRLLGGVGRERFAYSERAGDLAHAGRYRHVGSQGLSGRTPRGRFGLRPARRLSSRRGARFRLCPGGREAA